MFILEAAPEICAQPLVQTILSVVKTVFDIIKIGVPLVLILLCAIDLFKAMTSGDEKKQQEVRKTIVRRLIYALIIFLLIPLLSLLLNLVSNVVTINGKNADTESAFKKFLLCWGYDGSDTVVDNNNNGDVNSGNEGQCVCVDANNSYIASLDRDVCEGMANAHCAN